MPLELFDTGLCRLKGSTPGVAKDEPGQFMTTSKREAFGEPRIDARAIQGKYPKSMASVFRGIRCENDVAEQAIVNLCNKVSIMHVFANRNLESPTAIESWSTIPSDHNKSMGDITRNVVHTFFTLSDFANPRDKFDKDNPPDGEGRSIWNFVTSGIHGRPSIQFLSENELTGQHSTPSSGASRCSILRL